LIQPHHALPANPQIGSPDGQRLPAVAAATPADARERASRQPSQQRSEASAEATPAEAVLDGELLEELREYGQLHLRGHRLDGAGFRASTAINAYESVRSASPRYASTQGLLLDTYV
jgi:hypothetical protein